MKGKILPSSPAKRGFAYVRVSVDEEAGNNASIQSQKAELRRYADQHGIEIIAVFEEPDVSGRRLKRPQFDRMIALACGSDRPVDYILTYSLSRFARRLQTQLNAESSLKRASVALITILEGSANSADGQFTRHIMGAVNEKYAVDCSTFTRRDRRTNAENGFWNGGPVPFGYRSQVARTDGRKERKILIVHEEEAAIVRLIYALALHGIDGQPMGTRSIALHLNGLGHKLAGKPFRHSSVDGILTREHYAGYYHDRTAPEVDQKATEADRIRVACPKIIEPELITAVAAKRAKAAPRVTPPRVTNGPTLLTGLCNCGEPGCGAGLTLRSGKGGRYSYYTCNRRAEAAQACSAKPIPTKQLDDLVIAGLLERILQPARLKKLLAEVLDLSDAADEQRQQELDRVRRARVETESKLRRLLELVANGAMSLDDPTLGQMLADYKGSIAALRTTENNLSRALSTSKDRIDAAALDKFGRIIREKMSRSAEMRKAYLRLFVSEVTVSADEIRIAGSKAALEAAVAHQTSPKGGVPRFDREWCRLQDSNL